MISTAAAAWQHGALPADARFDLDQPMLAPWWYAFGVARAAELVAWIVVAARPGRRALAGATVAGAIAIVAGAMLRDGARLHALELLRPRAIAAGGVLVFALFAVLTIAALVALYLIVKRGLADGPTRRA